MIHLNEKSECCGCTACASICGKMAIEMCADEEGFLYPILDTSLCINCHLCENVCPVSYRDNFEPNIFPKNVYALYHRDSDIHKRSSSGGVFFALSEECIRKKGIIYGASYNDNFEVIHCGETTSRGALKFRGSKYVQSDIRGVYRDIQKQLNKGTYILFSGTPCQVQGLTLFLRKEYENLITVDILCHGVPSPIIFAEYIKFIKRHSVGHLKDVFMKDKTFGWGYQDLRLFFCEGYSEFNSPLSSIWNKIFYEHIANRPSCHKCRFTNTQRPGDITIGDFWGIEKYHKNLYSQDGVSVLMVNTSKGEKIWNLIKQNFYYTESNLNECMQPVLYRPQSESNERTYFWDEFKRNGFERTIRNKYHITSSMLIKNQICQILNIIRNK